MKLNFVTHSVVFRETCRHNHSFPFESTMFRLVLLLLCFSVTHVSRDMTKPTNGCAPSEDSDQPGHPPSLIRVFAVRMKKALVLNDTLSAQQRL